MKGKVTCPKCLFNFVVESDKEGDKKVKCPRCGYEFIARIGKVKSRDVKWIEYGGVRKAILPIPKNLSNRPIIAGTLLAIVFFIDMITISLFYTYPDVNLTLYSYIPMRYYWLLTALTLAFSVMCAIGAYSSINKKSFGMAVSGSVFGILSFGLLAIGPAVSIVALILLASSKDEFENSIHGKEF